MSPGVRPLLQDLLLLPPPSQQGFWWERSSVLGASEHEAGVSGWGGRPVPRSQFESRRHFSFRQNSAEMFLTVPDLVLILPGSCSDGTDIQAFWGLNFHWDTFKGGKA